MASRRPEEAGVDTAVATPPQDDVTSVTPLSLEHIDAEVPIALLPVRLETVFATNVSPPLLKIRIYPDEIHADALARTVSEAEIDAAKRFWEEAWDALASTWPLGWIDERLQPVVDLLAFLNAAEDADTLEPLPSIGDVLAGRILSERPADGYANLAQVIELVRISYGVLGDLLDHFADGPEAQAEIEAEVARVSVVPEEEALEIWHWAPGERTAVLDFVNRATSAELDAVADFGEVIVGRMVETRDDLGGFPDLFTVAAVEGIGVGRLDELRTHLAVDPMDMGEVALAAWRALAEEVGLERGAWAARVTRPVNEPWLGEVPQFPDVASGPTTVATTSALLPRSFVAIGYQDGRVVFEEAGRTIPSTLQLGPDLSSEEALAELAESEGDMLALDEGTRWMVDYDEAVAKGMAITVRLTGDAAAALDGLDELVVYGVRVTRDLDGTAAALAALLESHRYGDGLGFLAQGTPTNNTDTVRSPWKPEETDDRYTQELGAVPAPLGTPNAARFERALGLAASDFLGRVEGGADREQDEQAAMNRLIWWAMLEGTFNTLFTGETGLRRLLDSDGQRWLETFFVDRVRGGGPVPALRVDRQPYGILPISAGGWWEHAGERQDLFQFLWRLRPRWTDAEGDVPRLDPDRMDELAASEMEVAATGDAELVRILAAQEHPADLRVAGLEDRRYAKGGKSGIETQYTILRLICHLAQERTYPQWNAYLPEDDIDYADIEQQIGIWNGNRSEFARVIIDLEVAGDDEEVEVAQSLMDLGLDPILTLLESHKERVEQAREGTGGGPTRPDGVVTEDDARILYALYDDAEPEAWGPARVESDAEGAPDASTWLAWLAERCDLSDWDTIEAIGPFESGQTRPLLYELARRAITEAGATTNSSVRRDRLDTLRAALETLAAVPSDRLDQRLRETLGLLGPRIDAWFTALAWDRLDTVRATLPVGCMVGAYGWVEGLQPDLGSDLTRGFVHAPSLDHAATAAVLRAGWLAHGTHNPTSPGAVDLTGDRLRTATVILDGLRHGQSFGAMLGYRFERVLRDQGLSVLIHRYRDALAGVAASLGEEAAPGVIDGELLLDHLDHPDVEAVRTAALADAALPPDTDVRLQSALDGLAVALDASADVVLAEATYQLVRGNPSRAGAVFEAVAAGDRPPPELEVIDTPRPGPAIQHRIALMWPADLVPAVAWPGEVAEGDAALEAWLATLLGDPASVGFVLEITDPDGTVRTEGHDLSEVGLSAAAYVDLAPTPEVEVSPGLEAHLAETLGAGRVVASDAAGRPTSLTEHGLLAAALRTLLGRSRPLVEADLADPSEGMERPAEPVLAPVPAGEAWQANIGRSGDRVGDDRAIEGWLQQHARVRGGVARWVDVAVLADLLVPGAVPAARVAQWPDPEEGAEPWAAQALPAQGGRTCMVVVGPAETDTAESVVGLVVDEWVDRIPAESVTTGVAFHVDSPAARPPQAVLLAVSPEAREKWSDTQVVSAIREALALARLRPVEVAQVEGIGHLFPVSFNRQALAAPEVVDG